MYTAYVIAVVLAIAVNTFSATCDFIRYPKVLSQMAKANVPESLLPTLAALKAAGVAGLVVGFFVPWIGIAAATGLVLFYFGAFIAHIRARFHQYSFPTAYLLVAAAALGLSAAVL
ncbi:DoxX family protein [Actinomadura sp. 6N118]|uniref:DoxX family protein n=1 Tax=Actinomadura sp. 6N118 TaxID=3375151 RepID=UPI00379F7B26